MTMHRVVTQFRPIPLDRSVPTGFDLVPDAAIWSDYLTGALRTLPGGSVSLWNVPFTLAPQNAAERWVWLGPEARSTAVVTIGASATFVVFAHFTLPVEGSSEEATSGRRPSGFVTAPGEHVAEYVVEYADGQSHRQPIRRRFEVHDLVTHWGQMAFLARPHRAERARDWRGPHDDGEWGENQTSALLPAYWGVDSSPEPSVLSGTYWIYALENPRPEAIISGIQLRSTETAHVALAGVTLFEGHGHPLRYGPTRAMLLTRTAAETPAPSIDIELGTIARRYPVWPTSHADWMAQEAGLGAPIPTSAPAEVIEVTAAQDAVLHVGSDAISLADLAPGGQLLTSSAGRIEPVPVADRTVEVSIVDGSSGRPTPARVHFETADGRYLPPHGHRHEVNDRWFEDYGADLKLGGTQYAYVDGRFRIDLPAGDVRVEIVKGFEYVPLRQTIQVPANGAPLELSLDRALDIRGQGWLSADTHVHFISPETARLEAEAEGVNVVNLLAAQWGDLYTNVGDFTGASAGASTYDTVVWVGTENRQHMLGHLSMLGIQGQLPNRLSAGGPSESFIGEPVWDPLAHWADEAHAHGGLVVIPHFPNPHCEVVADVALGKVDALEVRDFWWGIDSHSVIEWYGLLNCGFRVPAVGGTDKMSAGIPVGGVRTYAKVGDAGVTFESFADAVRGGRTTTSSGPFLDLAVEGTGIGGDIPIGRKGRVVEVEARADAVYELTALEIVHNGTVVARREAEPGSRQIRLSERLPVSGGWLAARAWGPGRAFHYWPVRVAAHTSPVYLTGAALVPKPDDLSYLMTLLEGGKAWLGTLATGSPVEIRRAQAVFNEAANVLSRLRSAKVPNARRDTGR